MSASVRQLSVLPAELPAAIERMQGEAKDQKRVLNGLHAEISRYRAEELAMAAETIPLTTSGDKELSCRFVAVAIDADATGLKNLASAIIAQPGFVVALTSTSTPALAVIARSADIAISAQHLLTQLIAEFGGRGGGRPEMAQAGGINALPTSILTTIRTRL
jgi:alanyl-tRNA synthetase